MIYTIYTNNDEKWSESLDEIRAYAVSKLVKREVGSNIEIYRQLAHTAEYFGYVSKIKFGSDSKSRYLWHANGVWEIGTNGKIKRRM